MEDEKYLTVPEVAERLRLSRITVRRWLREGKLRGTLLSDAAGYRVPESEVRRILRGAGSTNGLSI